MATTEHGRRATVTDLAAARRDREAAVPDGGDSRPGPSRKTANRRFDVEKVERLKAEIAAGRYVIDAERVADRFIEHERNN